jgi:hypothetical protein
MQPPKVRKTWQKPTICPCGSTTHAPKSRGQGIFDAGVCVEKIECISLYHTILEDIPNEMYR